MLQKPRGTLDFLPSQTGVFRFIENAARTAAAAHGFGEIRFPAFESTELFSRGVGDTTDVVQKEMYSFADKEGRLLTLRPEGTASVARSIVENGLYGDTMPLKLYYIINCFRYEKPEAGRSREFPQFGVELYGAPSGAADAAVISLAYDFFNSLGITDMVLNLNSIGCDGCKPQYLAALKAYFSSHESELCPVCRERLQTNPMRLLDCKDEGCSKLALGAPKTVDYLCDDCKAHFSALTGSLEAMGIPFVVNPKVVRGLDYYTRTVFEFMSASSVGTRGTLGGGGRYDNLVSEIGGPSLCGIGFAVGLTRLALELTDKGYTDKSTAPRLYIASMGGAAANAAAGIAARLRRSGVLCEYDIVGRSLKAQMKYANKIGAEYCLIIGDSELESGRAPLRKMSDSSQVEIGIDETVSYFINI